MATAKFTDEQIRQRLERRDRELDAARRISLALFQHLDVDELVEQALRIALEVSNGQAGCVLLADPKSKQLVFYHAIGKRPLLEGRLSRGIKALLAPSFKLRSRW